MAMFDIEKAARYPIVLSDSLAGKGNKELFTSIRFNHKPNLSTNSLESQRLKPLSHGSPQQYELSVVDGDDGHTYQGTRSTEEGEYVLIFNPVEKHFVIHQLDSTFDMNLVRYLGTNDPEYAQIRKKNKLGLSASLESNTGAVDDGNLSLEDPAGESKRRKVHKPRKPRRKSPTPDAEDEDSDDGLTIEYPGAVPPQPFHSQTMPVLQQTEASDTSDANDDCGEYEDDIDDRNRDIDALRLPSPIAAPSAVEAEDELELDLEAELEQALASENKGDESSESEEE